MAARSLREEERIAFARDFRAARAFAQRDAEGFGELLFALERLGSFLTQSHHGLTHFRPELRKIAEESILSYKAARTYPNIHLDFDSLYDLVRLDRNDALHQGAIARQLAGNAQEVALIMEDALMSPAKTAKQFMIRDPVCAESFYPLTAIRRTMLLNAFSYLPFRAERSNRWRVISDFNIAAFLRSVDRNERDKRLLYTLDEALSQGLRDTEPMTCGPDDPVSDLVARMEAVPYLVVSDGDRLVGLITAYDLL